MKVESHRTHLVFFNSLEEMNDTEIILQDWSEVKKKLYLFFNKMNGYLKEPSDFDMEYLASTCTIVDDLTLHCSRLLVNDSVAVTHHWTQETFLPNPR